MNGPAYGAAGTNYADGIDFKGARLTTDHTDHTDRHEHSDSFACKRSFRLGSRNQQAGSLCFPEYLNSCRFGAI